MNTARAFGPAAVAGFPNGSHWIVSRIRSPLPHLAPTLSRIRDLPFVSYLFLLLCAKLKL
jgi:hypothetical protein